MVSTAVRTFARGIPWNLFLLTLGCGLFALGVKAIAIPHMLISGGVFGTALLINYMTETLSPAVWNVLLNIPIFIAGWLLVAEFIFTLAMAVKCYPWLQGGWLPLTL